LRDRDRFKISDRFFDAIWGAEGTIVADFVPYVGSGLGFISRYSRVVGDAAAGNFQIQYQNGNNLFMTAADNAGAAPFAFNIPVPLFQPFRAALAFGQNSFAGKASSSVVVDDTSGDVPTDLTRIEIGGSNLSSAALSGVFRSLTFYNRRLTNAEISTAVQMAL
jgi:hypothetical protein